MKIKAKVYGLGGHDESKPDNNIVEVIYYSKEEEAELQKQAEADTAKAAAQAKLAALGLTTDDLKALGL